jgi:hypothetical protein
LIVLVLAAVLSLGAISANTLKTDVEWLADAAREGRKARTPGGSSSAEYIAERFRQIGFEVQFQDFGFSRRNVIARLGTSPTHIIIGSHYDGQGPGYPSASDNAAGIGALLELARELKSESIPVSLVMIAFDDEEQGLNGSRYYSENPILPLKDALAAIIFDTMGRNFIDLSFSTMFVLGTEYSPELAQIVGKRGNSNMLVVGTDLIGPRSDFAPFAVKQVPYLFFSHGTHRDYHGMADTADKLNYSQLAKDVELIGRVIQDIARTAPKPAYSGTAVYPPSERATLIRYISALEKERMDDLAPAYQTMLQDMLVRIRSDKTRDSLRVATSGLLAIATPRLSSFMLTFILGPYYEREAKPLAAAGFYEEALKWTTNPAERDELTRKIAALRSQPGQ